MRNQYEVKAQAIAEVKAQAIAKEFGFELEAAWEGYKPFWHVWHQPKLLYWITYEQYLYRIIEIKENKPKHELQHRFRLLKPVTGVLPVELCKAWMKVDEAWMKWNEAWVESRMKWNVAWVKLNETYQKYLPEIQVLHLAECKGCLWNEKESQLVFPK